MSDNVLPVVVVYFNPYKWKSRKRLYQEFVPYAEHSGAKVLTVEIGYKGQPFEVTDPNNLWHVQVRSQSDMWHKEAGLNLGIARLLQLMPDADKIAWIDADVKFANPNWVQDTLTALDHFKVVQMYSHANSLDPSNIPQWVTPSIFYNYRNNIGYSQNPPLPLSYTQGGHPGLAWAARIETLNALGGLLDFCIHGSADTYMANAFMGDITHAIMANAPKDFVDGLNIWAERAYKHVNRNIGFVPGLCMHYWHGKPQVRGYEKRWDIVCFHQFDPFVDIYKDASGLYQFAGNKPDLAYDLTRSLTSRNEDSIDVK